MINDALESLVTAVETGRTDVIQNIIKTVQKCEENDEGIGLTLNNLFRSECSEHGTILHLAVRKRSKDSVRTLLTSGAFPSCKNEEGQTALEIAEDKEIIAVFNEQLLHNIAQGNLSRVEELLDAGCDSNCIDSERARNTPLHWAASYGTAEIVQLLIDDGSNVNAQNSDGVTPLHDAIQRGDKNIINILMINHADPHIAPHNGKLSGRTCMDIADESLKPYLQRQSSTELVRPQYNELKPPAADLTAKPPITPYGTVAADLSQLANNVTPQRNTQDLSALALKMRLEDQSNKQEVTVDVHIDPDEVDSLTCAAHDHLLKLLWPPPQKLTVHPDRGVFKPNDKMVIAAVNGPESGMVHEILNAWRAKRQSFLDLHIEFVMETIAYQTTPAIITFDLPSIVCLVDKSLFKQAESYKVTILQNQVRVVASDLAGLHYAVSTLIQLLEIFDQTESIPCLQIIDWPDIPRRGVMLDCSKGRIVHEANLWELVDRLSILKINEVHLYTRFGVPRTDESNPDIWQFPYTRSMLIEFDRFCQQRFVTLVPVLDVASHVTFEKIPTLFPVFLDFLSCFTYSRKINIGPRLSLMLLDIGESGVLSTRNFLPLSDSHQLLICGEALKQSDNIHRALMWLPSNMMLMSYGYSPDFDFTSTVKEYRDFGCSFYVCPGTSAWNSLAGCPFAAIKNIYNAVQQGADCQALGVLICDWSGKGHVTDQLFSLPPQVAGAGIAWSRNVTEAMIEDRLARLIDVHILCDQNKMVGQVIIELGKLESDLVRISKNKPVGESFSYGKDCGSVLFQLLSAPDHVDLTHLTATSFQRSMRAIRHLHAQVSTCELQCYQGQEQIKTLKVVLDLALTACRMGQALAIAGRNPNTATGAPVVNVGIANLPATAKTDLANRLLAIKDAYKSTWLSRNLPQGQQDSQTFVFHVISQLLSSKSN